MAATDPVQAVVEVVQSRAISIEDAWAVLAAARPAIEREAKAAALREAAEAFEVIIREHRAAPDVGVNDFVVDAGLIYAVADLRARADRIEAD